MTAYREPGRAVDETEIERAKIHEAAETRRKAIEEHAKTKRARLEKLGPVPAILAGAIVLVAIIATATTVQAYFESKTPKLPEPCVEKVEVITRNSDARKCEGGGRIETTRLEGTDVLWKCVCSAPVANADGGAP